MFTLLDIERYCSKLKARRAWELRQLLAATPREKVPMVAKAKLKEWRPPKDPSPGVRVTRRAGRNHTLSITDSSLNISKLLAVLKSTDRDLLTAAHTVFRGGGGSGQTLQSNVIVRLDELDRIVDGDGEEIELQLTNGATMTGAEFVREKLADLGLITLVHPHHGPVNLYMANRFANLKQRLALSAEHPTCAWPGCNAPAEDSQIHITSPASKMAGQRIWPIWCRCAHTTTRSMTMTRKSPPAAGTSTASMAACTTCRRGRGRRFLSRARLTRRMLLNVQLIMLQRVGLLEHPRIRRHTARPDRLTAPALGRRRVTPASLRTAQRAPPARRASPLGSGAILLRRLTSPRHAASHSRFNQPLAEKTHSACGYSRARYRGMRISAVRRTGWSL